MPINDPELDALLGRMPSFGDVQGGASSTGAGARVVDPELDALLNQGNPQYGPLAAGAQAIGPPSVDAYTQEHYVPFTSAYYALPKNTRFGNIQEKLKPVLGMNMSAQDVVGALPAIGATAGAGAATAMTGGVAAPILAAVLGGGGGEAYRQVIDTLAGAPPKASGEEAGRDIVKEGALQGAYEATGQGVSAMLTKPLAHLVAGLRPRVISQVDKLVEEFGLTPQVSGFAKKIVGTTVLGRNAVAREQELALGRVADEVASLGSKTTGKAVPPPAAHPDDVLSEIDKTLELARDQDKATALATQDLRTALAKGAHEQVVGEAAAKVAAIKAVSAQTVADAEKAASTLIESMAAEKSGMIAGVKAGAQQQMDQELATLANKIEADIAGGQIRQQAIGRGVETASGATIGAREAERLYSLSEKAAEGVLVPVADFKAQAEGFLERLRMRPTPERPLEALGQELGVEQGIPKEYRGKVEIKVQKKLPEGVPQSETEWGWLEKRLGEMQGNAMPFEKAREIQQWLAAHLPWEKVSQTQQKGVYKSLWGTLTEKMEGALAEHGAFQPFHEANTFWHHYADVFKRGAVPTLLRKDPEAVIGLVMGKEGGVPSRAKALREAVVGFAERYGSEEEKAAAQESWQLFQRQFAEKKLLGGGLEKFEANSAKVGDETLTQLFGDDTGSAALSNLRDISAAYKNAEKAINETIKTRTREINAAKVGVGLEAGVTKARADLELQQTKNIAGEALATEQKNITRTPPQVSPERSADEARLEMIRRAVGQSKGAIPGGAGLGGYITPGFLIYGLARHIVTTFGIAASVELIGDMTARAMFHPQAARALISGLDGIAKGSTTGIMRVLDWYLRDRQSESGPPSTTPTPTPSFEPVTGLRPPPQVSP